jgi:hypothetical protein
MTTTRWMITSLLALTAPLGLLASDGDDGDDADDVGDESTGDESTGGEGDETLGRTDVDVGTDLDADGPLDFGEASGESGEPMGCAVHVTADECTNAMGCTAVQGNAIVSDGADGWCSAPEAEYIGCVASDSLCPPLEQTVCAGEQMWTTTGCVPDSLTICEPPGDDIIDICA